MVYHTLERVIVARTMGTRGDNALREKLLALQRRLVADASRLKSQSSTPDEFAEEVAYGNTENAIALMKRLTTEYYCNSTENPFHTLIARLISMCEGSIRLSYSTADVSRVIRAHSQIQPEATQLPIVEPDRDPTYTFTCPITLDDPAQNVVLLISKTEGIFSHLAPEKVQAIINCPLALLQIPEARELVIASLDHPISIEALQSANTNTNTNANASTGMEVSPMTRKPVLRSGIFLGECEEHCQASNWALGSILTGDRHKIVGNPDLWFAVIYLLARDIPYLEPVLPLMREQLRFRMRNHTTYATLQGLPEFVTTRLTLQAALWYVLASPLLQLPPNRDAIRRHLRYAHIMETLLDIANVVADLPPHVQHHRKYLIANIYMKSVPSKCKTTIRYLYQDSVPVSTESLGADMARLDCVPRRIFVDGPVKDEDKAARYAELPIQLRNLGLTVNELYTLVEMEHDTPIPCPLHILDIDMNYAYTVNWSYGLNPIPHIHVPIGRETCRPAPGWKQQAELHYGPLKQILSLTRYYADFVRKYERFPYRDELMVYTLNRVIASGKGDVLPAAFSQFVDEVMDEYAGVTDLGAGEFIKRYDVFLVTS